MHDHDDLASRQVHSVDLPLNSKEYVAHAGGPLSEISQSSLLKKMITTDLKEPEKMEKNKPYLHPESFLQTCLKSRLWKIDFCSFGTAHRYPTLMGLAMVV